MTYTTNVKRKTVKKSLAKVEIFHLMAAKWIMDSDGSKDFKKVGGRDILCSRRERLNSLRRKASMFSTFSHHVTDVFKSTNLLVAVQQLQELLEALAMDNCVCRRCFWRWSLMSGRQTPLLCSRKLAPNFLDVKSPKECILQISFTK